MCMKLSSEIEHLVLDNQKLVHYLVKEMGVTQISSDYEDIISIGTIGLIKAAINFNTSRNVKFATYVSRCIKNEIYMHYRKNNKYAKDISIYEPVGINDKGNEVMLIDRIEDSESDFVEKIVEKEEFIYLVKIVLNCLKGKYRIIFLYLMAYFSQEEISKKLKMSQSYISRVERKAIQQVRNIRNQQIHYNEIFSMRIVGNQYEIYFSFKEINKFNKSYTTLLGKLKSVEKLPDFKVNYNKEQIIIQIPAHPKSFAFVAQIIQEIDDFNMIQMRRK